MKTRKNKHRFLMFCTLIASLIYISWRIFFTLPLSFGPVSLIAGLALVIAETIGVIEAIEHYLNMSSDKLPEMPNIKDEEFPDVDVLIATHNEDTKLLYKTINGCKHMRYPDKSKVHIYLCDDNDRPQMRDLAKQFGIGYFGLADNKFAKAGNINNALRQTNSPLVATFDADMIPTSRFLLETVPYFFLPQYKKDGDGNWIKNEKEDKEKVGFIQTPQSFYNPDLFQYNLYSEKNIPNEQDYFFREINIGRNRTNSAIYAGSNTVISRQALEDVGYIVEGSITEDFATGIEIQKKGYLCFAIDKTLAHGLAPTDLPGLIKQRERWGRGCVQTMRSSKLIFSKMPFGAKLSYISSFLYWWTFLRRFIYIASPILFTVFGIRIVECELWQLALFWLPYYLLYNHSLKILSGEIRTQRWSNIVDTIIFPYMIIPIFLESIGVRQRKFFVTSKKQNVETNSYFIYAAPHIILAIASIIGLGFSINNVAKSGLIHNFILIFWLTVNLYFLVMALIFMSGRINFKHEERLAAKVKVKVYPFDNYALNGETVDISESGMRIKLDFPEYVPYDDEIDVYLETDTYQVRIPVLIRHVEQVGRSWLYSMKISDKITDEQRRVYLQIVFDRHHTLPIVIKSGWITDFSINIKSRGEHKQTSNRRLPRIDLRNRANTIQHGIIDILDFNYEYIRIRPLEVGVDTLTLVLDNGLKIICDVVDDSRGLYKVHDWRKIAEDRRLRQTIEQWLNPTSHQNKVLTV